MTVRYLTARAEIRGRDLKNLSRFPFRVPTFAALFTFSHHPSPVVSLYPRVQTRGGVEPRRAEDVVRVALTGAAIKKSRGPGEKRLGPERTGRTTVSRQDDSSLCPVPVRAFDPAHTADIFFISHLRAGTRAVYWIRNRENRNVRPISRGRRDYLCGYEVSTNTWELSKERERKKKRMKK